MAFEAWMDILRCPACVAAPVSGATDADSGAAVSGAADPGQLELWADSWLVCQDCQRKYPIRNQIPVLLIEEGDKHQETSLDDLGTP